MFVWRRVKYPQTITQPFCLTLRTQTTRQYSKFTSISLCTFFLSLTLCVCFLFLLLCVIDPVGSPSTKISEKHCSAQLNSLYRSMLNFTSNSSVSFSSAAAATTNFVIYTHTHTHSFSLIHSEWENAAPSHLTLLAR